MKTLRGLTISDQRAIESQSKLTGSNSQSLFEYPLVNKGLKCSLRFSRCSIVLLELEPGASVFDFEAKVRTINLDRFGVLVADRSVVLYEVNQRFNMWVVQLLLSSGLAITDLQSAYIGQGCHPAIQREGFQTNTRVVVSDEPVEQPGALW